MDLTSGHGPRTRVVVFGLGTVGKAAVRLCTTRRWIDVVGAVVRTSVGDRGIDGLSVSTDATALLDERAPDVALIATRSTIAEVLPDIERCVGRGVNVICTSEELTYPAHEVREALETMARDAGAVIAATGINPGFVFDALPLAIAGAAWDVQRIQVSRSLDASVFGRSIHRSLGVGYDAAAFDEALAAHTIRGHIGFEESVNVIADAMGLVVTRFEESVAPLFADREYVLAEYRIEPGQTAGVKQRALAWVQGTDAALIEFDLSLHVAPGSAGIETMDRIRIEGENNVDLTIDPGTQAVLTTAARLVNTIPSVLRANPGFYAAADLLPSAPWLSNAPPPGAR